MKVDGVHTAVITGRIGRAAASATATITAQGNRRVMIVRLQTESIAVVYNEIDNREGMFLSCN